MQFQGKDYCCYIIVATEKSTAQAVYESCIEMSRKGCKIDFILSQFPKLPAKNKRLRFPNALVSFIYII